ncbi:MAG: hypothetical protein AB9872_02815 [Solidesulfovibrio sp.]
MASRSGCSQRTAVLTSFRAMTPARAVRASLGVSSQFERRAKSR